MSKGAKPAVVGSHGFSKYGDPPSCVLSQAAVSVEAVAHGGHLRTKEEHVDTEAVGDVLEPFDGPKAYALALLVVEKLVLDIDGMT